MANTCTESQVIFPHTSTRYKTVFGRQPMTMNAILMLGPALLTIIVLFGGGLVLGILQGMGYQFSSGLSQLTSAHFVSILLDPDFFWSLLLSLYVSITSTTIAAVISVPLALFFSSIAHRNRMVQFVFQIPLTVPHVVIAVAVIFMMSPSGMISRAMGSLGMISNPSAFPLWINDTWGIGIITAYVWKEVPFITLMIVSVLLHTGKAYMDVGRTLKAGRVQRFLYITLPMIFPSLGAACLIVFAYTFGAFEIPFLLGRTHPILLPVWAYKNYSDVDLFARPEGIATGIIIAVVVIVSIILSGLLARYARNTAGIGRT
ncbi:MAG: sugar ABC transporter permease [Desulfobacteraceae bacterium]|nr:sugar ABC transporter permease [Desulfobacteraceae bacterium]